MAESKETFVCNNEWNLIGNHGSHLVPIFFFGQMESGGGKCLFVSLLLRSLGLLKDFS